MHLNALVVSIARHPVTQAAALKLATDVLDGGLGPMIDRVLDRVAYSIAKQIVQNERQTQETS